MSGNCKQRAYALFVSPKLKTTTSSAQAPSTTVSSIQETAATVAAMAAPTAPPISAWGYELLGENSQCSHGSQVYKYLGISDAMSPTDKLNMSLEVSHVPINFRFKTNFRNVSSWLFMKTNVTLIGVLLNGEPN